MNGKTADNKAHRSSYKPRQAVVRSSALPHLCRSKIIDKILDDYSVYTKVYSHPYFFGTITEILVLPEYQKQGIGEKLMSLAFETSPTSLFFGAQPEAVAFYEKIGYEKSLQSFSKKKPRKQ
jgi:ribosomal protein S18 acetylase RimI-like enzyme